MSGNLWNFVGWRKWWIICSIRTIIIYYPKWTWRIALISKNCVKNRLFYESDRRYCNDWHVVFINLWTFGFCALRTCTVQYVYRHDFITNKTSIIFSDSEDVSLRRWRRWRWRSSQSNGLRQRGFPTSSGSWKSRGVFRSTKPWQSAQRSVS